MGSSFTTFWDWARVRAGRKAAVDEGYRLRVLFGGPHLSLPSFLRAGVSEGDWIYPVGANKGAMHVLGRVRVVAVGNLGILARQPYEMSWDERRQWLAPTCHDEAVAGADGTPIWNDLVLPGEELTRLRYVSRRGERGVKYAEDGVLKKSLSIQGIYRLAPASADVLAGLVEQRLRAEASSSAAAAVV